MNVMTVASLYDVHIIDSKRCEQKANSCRTPKAERLLDDEFLAYLDCVIDLGVATPSLSHASILVKGYTYLLLLLLGIPLALVNIIMQRNVDDSFFLFCFFDAPVLCSLLSMLSDILL